LSRTTVAIRRSVAGFLTLLALTSLAQADSPWWMQNDAGSGHDASGSWLSPLALPDYGSYSGTLVEHDSDAYAVRQASTSPACLNFSFTPTSNDVLTVKTTSGGVDKAATLNSPAGVTQRGGIATNAYDWAGLRATLANPEQEGANDYSFTLQRVDATSSVPAPGHTISTATPLPSPCTAGVMSAVSLAATNTYSLGPLPAGTNLVASLAATASSLSLQVLDAGGNPIAQTSVNGVTTATTPSAGNYYLSVQRTDLGVGDVQYLIGVIVSPGCKPAC